MIVGSFLIIKALLSGLYTVVSKSGCSDTIACSVYVKLSIKYLLIYDVVLFLISYEPLY